MLTIPKRRGCVINYANRPPIAINRIWFTIVAFLVWITLSLSLFLYRSLEQNRKKYAEITPAIIIDAAQFTNEFSPYHQRSYHIKMM